MCRRQRLVGDVNLRDVETMSVSQGAYGSTASVTGDVPREYGDLALSPSAASQRNGQQVSTYGSVNGGGSPAASTGYVAVPPLGSGQYGASPADVRHYSPMGMQR
jgi:hypothetical protein